MAEREGNSNRIASPNQQRIVWEGLLLGDTGEWVVIPYVADKTVQISGAAGAGGTITIEGTNEQAPDAAETIVSVLDDIISNTPLSGLVPLDMGLIGENPLWLRPVVAGGDGATNFKVVINAVGVRRR